VAKRFIVVFVTFIGFIGLIIPAAFALALLAAPARPAPLERPGCERKLADAVANVTVLQARAKAAHGPEACAAARLYFLELVKARAMTALCKSGPERERDLGRLDADVENINSAIAARCS
jgi:hypothetical protein